MITITKGPETLSFKSWTFPDGATGVRLDTDNHRYRYANVETGDLLSSTAYLKGYQTVTARIQSADDIMELVMVTDALKRFDPTPIHLVLPTMPYARQDRPCVAGEAHSLKAFANLINGLGFAKVTTYDPHSDVTGAVFNNLTIVDRLTIIGRFDELNAAIVGDPKAVFVAPDAGANKATSALAKHYNHDRFVRADKLRELATGKILETVVYGDVTGLTCVIPDDCADGGATFAGLAKVLKEKGAARVILYVTHGMFFKGFDHLWAAGIDHIYTTNAFKPTFSDHPQLTVLDLEATFNRVAIRPEGHGEDALPPPSDARRKRTGTCRDADSDTILA